MGTLVCFHAHPDDESISTGGSMARAKDEGHRVVLVVATDGDHGEVPDDLAVGEPLVDRRKAETTHSAQVLGLARVVWLGYRGSGMTGWEQNDHDGSFLQAPLDEAAERLARVLSEESADILVTYDWHGNYGHPDHIKVHQVGHRAAELAATPTVFEVTMNRDHIGRLMAMAAEFGAPTEQTFDPDGPADDGNPFGTPEVELTHAVDVTAHLAQKRASMRCHRSQISDTSFFLEMPDEAFATGFGTEWYTKRKGDGALAAGSTGAGPRAGWLFE